MCLDKISFYQNVDRSRNSHCTLYFARIFGSWITERDIFSWFQVFFILIHGLDAVAALSVGSLIFRHSTCFVQRLSFI